MSYILDALRKSDQQRQLGAAPTLQMAQTAATVPKKPAYLSYGLLAAVLLCAGIAIGWLRPWQAEPPADNKVVAAKPPDASLRPSPPGATPVPAPVSAPEARLQSAAPPAAPVPAPARAPAAAPAKPVVPAPVPARAAAASSAPLAAAVRAPSAAPASVKPHSAAPAKAEGKPQDTIAAPPARVVVPEAPPAAAAAPAQNVIWLAELPLALQQELPPMTVSVHAYSARPADRMVGINNRMLREGEYVAPGLKLEQITPEGMVFGYKGYSFRRGVK